MKSYLIMEIGSCGPANSRGFIVAPKYNAETIKFILDNPQMYTMLKVRRKL